MLAVFMNTFLYLRFNRFNPVAAKSIEARLTLANSMDFAEITDLQIDRSVYRPKDKISARARLACYKGQTFTTNLAIELPADIEEGEYLVNLSSGYFWLSADAGLSPEKYLPEDLEQAFDLLSLESGSRSLCLWLVTKRQGVLINGKDYENLPRSKYEQMLKTRSARKSPSFSLIKSMLPQNFPVTGMKSLRFSVKKDIYE
ncbi:MAG TPA: hypothetical protein DC049_19285 [Spirochaetia bacterium]|nr:hypothetical protein [Spirochaetia bacterium]